MRGRSKRRRKIRKIHYLVRERKCALSIRLHTQKAPSHKNTNPFERRDLELRMLLKMFPACKGLSGDLSLRFSCPSSQKPLQLWSEQLSCTPSWQQILAVPSVGCWFCTHERCNNESSGRPAPRFQRPEKASNV